MSRVVQSKTHGTSSERSASVYNHVLLSHRLEHPFIVLYLPRRHVEHMRFRMSIQSICEHLCALRSEVHCFLRREFEDAGRHCPAAKFLSSAFGLHLRGSMVCSELAVKLFSSVHQSPITLTTSAQFASRCRRFWT